MAIQPISKFRDGLTLSEYRVKRREKRKSKEKSIKTQLRIRDGIGCRWTGCDYWHDTVVEGAHLIDKGAGGDPQQLRTKIELMMRLCLVHHRGPMSLHSGHREIEFLTERKANGPCKFLTRKTLDDQWTIDGIENEFDVAKRVNLAAEEIEDDDDE